METQKQMEQKKNHLNFLIDRPYESSYIMFCDYLNYDKYLYDGLNIDTDVIIMINDYFYFYYLSSATFNHYFRNKLKLTLPKYYEMLKNEMRDELFEISNNKYFRRVADARINKALNFSERERNNQQTATNTNNLESKTNATDTSESITKNANKSTPMSSIASGFNDLFNWNTASEVSENKTNSEDNSNSTNTQNTESKSKAEDVEAEKQKIKNFANELGDTSELNKGWNLLPVESIDKINNFLKSNNHSIDFLLSELKKCFINVNM